MRISWHGEQAVIALGLALVLLLDLKNANDAASEDNAREGRGVVHDHDIDRVAVIGLGRGHEPPVVRIGKTRQQRLRQRKCLELWVVIELSPAAPGRFDHNANVTVFGKGRQIDKIWHRRSLSTYQKAEANGRVGKARSVRKGFPPAFLKC